MSDQGQPGQPPARESPAAGQQRPQPRRAGRRLVAFGVLVLLIASLVVGLWQHYGRYSQAMATAAQQRDFVPLVRVQEVRASDDIMLVTLPATTLGFEMANIYGRAGGYITKRLVDIGSRVKAGDLLVEVTDSLGVRFAHALVREALYEGMIAGRRWHARPARR